MRRILFGFIFFSIACLTTCRVALAAPPFPASATGTYYAFAEIHTDFGADGDAGFLIGSGYAMNKELTVGAQIASFGEGWALGGFATYYRKPLAINAEASWAFPGLSVEVDALYLLDVERFKAGVGGGALLTPDDLYFFVEGAAGLDLGGDLSAYLVGRFFPNIDDSDLAIGVTYRF